MLLQPEELFPKQVKHLGMLTHFGMACRLLSDDLSAGRRQGSEEAEVVLQAGRQRGVCIGPEACSGRIQWQIREPEQRTLADLP